jgi:hypothetical protein
MTDPMAGNGKMTWQRWNWRNGERIDQIKEGKHHVELKAGGAASYAKCPNSRRRPACYASTPDEFWSAVASTARHRFGFARGNASKTAGEFNR